MIGVAVHADLIRSRRAVLRDVLARRLARAVRAVAVIIYIQGTRHCPSGHGPGVQLVYCVLVLVVHKAV